MTIIMIDFKSTWVKFAPARGKKQRKSGSVTFSKPVQKANAAIKGLKIGYDDGDHHIYQLETDIDMGRSKALR